MDSLKHHSRAGKEYSNEDDADHRKYCREEMRRFLCKEHNNNNCDFNCFNSKYLAFHLSDLIQKKLDTASSPLFTEIDPSDRTPIPKTLRESTHSENRLLLQQQKNQHNLYLQYSMLTAKELCTTSTAASEICSLTPSNATGTANSWSSFSKIGRANSEWFNNRHLQQPDLQPTNSYDNSLNENISEPPKREEKDVNHIQNTALEEESFDTMVPQQDNHCIDTDLGGTGSTIPLTTSMGVSGPIQITSIDGFFNRKRGRPPKNRFVEVYKNTHQSPQAIFTSFKLEKNVTPNDAFTSMNDKQIFDHDAAFRDFDRMLTIPATITPRFTVIPQLPMYSTTDSTIKLQTEIDLQQKVKSSSLIITEDGDFAHLTPDDGVDLNSADLQTVREFMQKLQAKVALVAQRHTKETATTHTVVKFMKREMESLNEQQDHSRQHRSNVILNPRDLELRGGYFHIIPASPQQTSVQQLRDRESESLPSNRENPKDHGSTKSHNFKKVSVVRTVGTFFPECNEMPSYPSGSKLHSEKYFGRATTKPDIWSTRSTKTSCKRKRVQDDNKNMTNEFVMKPIEVNDISVPQDLSMRDKKKSPISIVYSPASANVAAYDFNGISKHVGVETTTEEKGRTTKETATTNIFDVELGWQNKEAIGLQLKHFFNLYQMQNH